MEQQLTVIAEEQIDNMTSTVEYLLRSQPSVHEATSCVDVLEVFHKDKKLYALPIVNDVLEPVGIITRLELTEYFSKQFAKELKGKKPISLLMDTTVIIVDKATEIEDIARIIIDAGIHHMVTGFIITDDNKYLGMATGYDLLNEISNRKQKQLFDLAHFDHLTGLPNRRLLLDRIQHSVASVTRNRRHSALLYIDLDHFKTINDTLGHHSGDLLLQQVAKRLNSTVRESDTVARLGGDEFVIMLEDLSEHTIESSAQIEAVGDKILAELGQPYLLDGKEYRVTPSIGATYCSDSHVSPNDLMRQADIAMYQAKKSGRNTLRFFDPEMQKNINERVFLENELRIALDERQLKLYYQIQVDSLNNHRICGAEALIRWIHPQRGLVSPAEFIPLAEDTGLILPMGQWVLEAACKQLVKWSLQKQTAALTIAVNVSAFQFKQSDFADRVIDVIEQTGANPLRLKLELTESMLLTDIESVISKMRILKQRGVSFSLDDFGTGYSSLSYLSQLPLDQLKIDRSFVMNLETDENSVVISSAIISLAHSLKLKVVAEGIETEAQSYILSATLSCDYLQGYLFGKPIPIEQLEELLEEY
jgi:diguanylate cyclase (GGDEF)-like protein